MVLCPFRLKGTCWSIFQPKAQKKSAIASKKAKRWHRWFYMYKQLLILLFSENYTHTLTKYDYHFCVVVWCSFFRAYETSLLVDQEISSEIPYNGKYICNFSVCNYEKKKNEQKESYLCDEKFRFEFPEISADECQWNGIFWNFGKREQPCEVYRNFRKFLTGNFRPIWPSARNFRFNDSLFGNSTTSKYFLRNFPCHLSPFRAFWLSGKRP